MVNIKNTLMTKTTALLLSIAMLISLIPVGVVSALASTPAELGELSCITENGALTDATGSDATATFADLTLNWSAADPSVGRTQDGWWVGVKMTAPAEMLKADDFTNVTYQRCTSAANDTWTDAKSFWDAQDSNKETESTERYLTMWGIVNEQYLNDAILNGTTINFSWRFDWNADGVYEQTASIKVDPKNIKLNKDGTQVYPATSGNGTVAVISEGLSVVDSANGNTVKVSYTSDTVLKWVAADPSVTRYNDGWWAGIKVTAPADLQTETDFADVTYQNKANGTWSEAKNFWEKKDSADNATEHSIGLWGLLNENYLTNADGNLEYLWRFDWDGDKVYEQIVVLEIDPANITLIDTNDVQVYPELGSVTTITGGTVEGSGTGSVTVTASDLTLNWSDKNETIGRNQAGWWAGIQITAPETAVVTEADDVKYQSKVGNGEWSAVKSFYKNQDSAKDGSVHYMQLWAMLDRAKLEAAVNADENISTQWRFDWDKDGNYEQIVTFEIVPNGIILNRVDRTDFTFTETATDKKVWIGDGTYKLEAKSELAPGTVSYTTTNDDFATVDNNGVVTLKKAGTVTVIATIAEDDVYNSDTASFTFEIVKKQVEGFKITSPSNIKYDYEDATYGVNKYVNEAIDPIGNGVIKYKVISGDAAKIEDETKPVLTIEKAGTVIVQALRLEDDKYYEAFAEYTLTIEKADQDGFKFTDSTPNELTYSFSDTYDTIKVEGGKVEGENVITYTITSGNDVAEVVDGNKIKTLKSGKFELAVKIDGNDCYNEKTISKEFTVVRDTRETFAFEEKGPFTVVYNENGNKFVKLAGTALNDLGNDEKENATITYEIVKQESLEDGDTSPEEKSVVAFDADGATLIINRSGKVTIKATISQTDKYEAFSVEYELTIEKDAQSFTFENGTEIKRYYGITEFVFMSEDNNLPIPTKDTTKADGVGHGIGNYTYELVGENNIAASYDSEKITFGNSDEKTGKLTIKVTKATDDCYKSCDASYTLEIVRLSPPSVDYKQCIDKELNANGWYDGDIKISALDEYTIGYDDSLIGSTWKEQVLFDLEGEFETLLNKPIVYLRRISDGAITSPINLDWYKMDKSEPENLIINYETSFFDRIGETLFGINADTVDVTISAEDNVSRIDYVWYSLDNGVTYPEEQKVELVNGEYTFPVPAQFRNKIEFKAYDMAANMTMLTDDAVLVVDAISPKINVSYNYFESKHQEVDNIIYSNDKVELTFDLTVDNFDLSVRPVVKVNDVEKTMDWTTTGTLTSDSFELSENGDYVVTFEFTDRLNRTTTYSKEIHIDKDAPIFDVTYDNNDVRNDNKYNDNRTATVKITEHNFKAEEVVFYVTAKDICHNNVEGYTYFDGPNEGKYVKEFYDYAKNAANWKYKNSNDEYVSDVAEAVNADVRYLILPEFAIDANYSVKLDYTDLAGNEATSYKTEFVVDKIAPSGLNISYEDANLIDTILGTLTFGFYKPDVKVTISATDTTAGIEYFTVDVKKQGIAEATNIELPDNLVLNADGTIKSGTAGFVNNVTETETDGKVELSFTVPAQFRGEIIIDSVTDLAHNTSGNYDDDNEIIVDTIAPIVSVVFDDYKDNASIHQNTDTKIDYYETDRSVTITVKEANFIPGDVKLLVTAKNSSGKNEIAGYTYTTDGYVKEFYEYAQNAENWISVGDIHTLKTNGTKFTIDANYTFDIEYKDRAQNNTQYKMIPLTDTGNSVSNYELCKFTIDRVDPQNLTVTYDGDVKTTILDKVLNVLTFGYYDAKVKVIITADDEVSGIDHFVYSYIKGTGVSNVNASLENVVIKSDKISQNGKTFTAEFEIPKDVLQNTNQFNGTVEFNAVERSTRSTDHKETATIIVDNIAPTATITYNEPVQKVNDISYYAGNIDAKIVINEANFNSDEVVVKVNDAAVDVKWSDDSVDVHTGAFTLTEDGDYVVNVTYTDRSKNEMTPYVSNQLTIDTKDPVINVSNVKHQSANNEETISFTVSVTDTNIALERFKPNLNAVIKKDNGNNSFTYETMAIALGDATTTTNANGETVHTYSVNNLEVDGFYSLVCTAVDYANHSVSIINSAADEGGNTTVETMNFSVNREGSVFWIETEHNDKYTGETLTDKLNGAYANDKVTIKLHEINVDKVDENAEKKTVFTLNDGSESADIVLEEGKNYSKNVIVGTGGWYETVYTLDNDNFDHDGVYSLNVITYDKADNSNVNTKTEAGTISFTLDRTNPVISANIKNDQSVNDTQFWVEFEITETNLDAETIVVKLTNNDGKTVETEVEDLGNNEYKFLVESGYNYSVEIVAKDLAGNESELYKVEHLTVSTNFFILWYANTPLFWGSIGGTVLLAGIIILLIFLKKRKKDEEK